MRQILTAVVTLFTFVFGAGIAKAESQISVEYGPYICDNKALTIRLEFYVNKLAGVSSLSNVTVKYGETLMLAHLKNFRNDVAERAGVSIKYGETEAYWKFLDTQRNIALSTQDEILSRNKGIRHESDIKLVSTNSVADVDRNGFANCFKQYKKTFYDQQVADVQRIPFFVFFSKAYIVPLTIKK